MYSTATNGRPMNVNIKSALDPFSNDQTNYTVPSSIGNFPGDKEVANLGTESSNERRNEEIL